MHIWGWVFSTVIVTAATQNGDVESLLTGQPGFHERDTPIESDIVRKVNFVSQGVDRFKIVSRPVKQRSHLTTVTT